MNIGAVLQALITVSALALVTVMAIISVNSEPVPPGHIVKMPPFGSSVDQDEVAKFVTLGKPKFYKLH